MPKRLFIYVFLVFTAIRPLFAIMVQLSDLVTMTKRSDLVIHGYVGDTSVITDEFGRLITLTQIEVIDPIHNAKSGEIITVYQVGGEIPGLVAPILGGQNYSLGQEVILFGLTLDNKYVSYGAGQGKFDVVQNTNSSLVIEDLGDVEVLSPNNPLIHSFATPLIYDDVNIFKKEIRNILNNLEN